MFIAMTVLGLLGCPLPPEENDSPKIPTLQQDGGKRKGTPNAGNKPGGTPSGAPKDLGGQEGKPKGGPGGVLLDMNQMSAQKTQEEIATQDHVKISGIIEGDCTGDIRLDVIPTENLGAPKEGQSMKGPITTLNLEALGAFTVLVPKSASVNLTALCDTDANQKITADVDKLSLGARLGVVDEDVSDVSLTLEAIKPPSAEDAPKIKEK